MKTEQTNTPDPQLRQQLDAKSKKFEEAPDYDYCEPSFSAPSITSLATARPRASPVSMSLRK
jgi:hypothetical protein